MNDTNIQWHPGFVAAMNLELREDRENLTFHKEYNLNTKPLSIDLLIIQKNASATVSNEIGKIFRRHNIMEYKSPGDSLDIDVYYKTMAYAALYKSGGEAVDSILANDVTISLIRENKPRKLFRHFMEQGCSVINPYAGIYYIEGAVPFSTQVIVTQELDSAAHGWLCALSRNIKEPVAQRVLELTKNLTEPGERNFADSVLTVMLKANKQMFHMWKGAGNMFEILMELMEPQIETMLKEEREKAITIGEQKGIRIGERTGILATINSLRNFGHSDADIKPEIMKNYHLSSSEADNYLSRVTVSESPKQQLQ